MKKEEVLTWVIRIISIITVWISGALFFFEYQLKGTTDTYLNAGYGWAFGWSLLTFILTFRKNSYDDLRYIVVFWFLLMVIGTLATFLILNPILLFFLFLSFPFVFILFLVWNFS